MNEPMKERTKRTNKQTEESKRVQNRFQFSHVGSSFRAMPCHASFQQQASIDGDPEGGKGIASTCKQIARVILRSASPNGSICLFI